MIRVRTGSRLHFGLFSLPAEQAGPWLNQEGEPTIPRRQFGGVGLMIREPGIQLIVDCAESWSADGPLAERALRFAQRYCQSVGSSQCFRIHVQSAGPEHVGLGTGTQLGLGVASAIAHLTEQPWQDRFAETLARHIGRGARSAVGIHGFQAGGFIVEAGKTSAEQVGTGVFRVNFPEDWHILLILPRGVQGAHGQAEVSAFTQLARRSLDDRDTEALCRIVLLGMLPAIFEGDLDAFGEALYDFNRRVGAMFQQAQGGIYAHARLEQIVRCLRELGIKGVGQSSWGPAIFAVVPADQTSDLMQRIEMAGIAGRDEVIITRAWDHPAKVRQK